MEQTQTAQTLETEFLSPETCVFFEAANGFLGAEINGEKHGRVILIRALPLTTPDDYISICDVSKKEIGMIKTMSAFTEDQQTLMKRELSMRYYCPTITQIIDIKEKMGHFYFDVKIGEHKKSITVKDISKSVRLVHSHVDLTDIDGNRYRILNLSEMPAKSRRMLEPYLY